MNTKNVTKSTWNTADDSCEYQIGIVRRLEVLALMTLFVGAGVGIGLLFGAGERRLEGALRVVVADDDCRDFVAIRLII